MGIRKAQSTDWPAITALLEQLDYPGTGKFLAAKIERLLAHPDEELLVYEIEGEVVACISLHFIPQLALAGDFARISYFSVDASVRGEGIGRAMEEYATNLADQRGCDRLEVHCHIRRTDAHRFYFRQGFTESPKYLTKKL